MRKVFAIIALAVTMVIGSGVSAQADTQYYNLTVNGVSWKIQAKGDYGSPNVDFIGATSYRGPTNHRVKVILAFWGATGTSFECYFSGDTNSGTTTYAKRHSCADPHKQVRSGYVKIIDGGKSGSVAVDLR